MKSVGVLLVLAVMLRSGSCLDSITKVRTAERLADSLDILQEDSQIESLAPVSEHSELFEMAKRLALKKQSLEGRAAAETLIPEEHLNNMDRLEDNSEEFMDLSIDIAYSAIYLLRNYTMFVHNARNKFIVVFE
ncbi:uncharacterized protein LOC131205557 [Anopheles bellator]|uniref:uncharacterized protein LOC131205557 n=1 Tax=Anopheles bellator TaxID=139047 RepID=UPI0026498361|nr:uncharacterized protein LOC131205557 [Anopheles bellator]